MNLQEIRLECLRELLRRPEYVGDIDRAIEDARKAADFVIAGGNPSSPEDTQRRG